VNTPSSPTPAHAASGSAGAGHPHVVLTDAPLASPRGLGAAWLVPVGAALLAGYLGFRAWSERGALVEVAFADGHGLTNGAAVQLRGIAVGRVEDVLLTTDASGVRARLRLRPEAANLAREGTRFWIARPRIGLSGVEGLDTLVGARYVALEPGPVDAAQRRSFDGLDEPPVEVPFEGGLEVVLEAARRGGLSAGAPVVYRELVVGVVLSVGLASDATALVVRAVIDPRYAELVREDTRFWNASGLELEAGLVSGVRVSIDSLEGLVTGAVAFATPPDAGPPARAGARFELAGRADDDWLDWVASLPVGASFDGLAAPRPVRASLGWKRRILGTRRHANGWCLRLEDAWIGPADVLQLGEGVDGDGAELSIDGASFEPLPHGSTSQAVAVLAAPLDAGAWRRSRLRTPLGPENCLVFGDPARGPIALDAQRLRAGDGPAWLVEGSFAEDWHGAAVVARSDGALVGLMLVDEGRARVALDLPSPR
jgi:hypothetical protein